MKIQKIFVHVVSITALLTIAHCGIIGKKSNIINETDDLVVMDTAAASDTAWASSAPEVDELLPFQNPPDKIWELLKTDLSINLDWTNRKIHGTAILELQPYFYKQDSLVLDAMMMDFKSISILATKTVPEFSPKFNYADSEKLVIYLPKPLEAKEKIQIKLVYTAKPEDPRLTEKTGTGIAISSEKGGYFINHDLSNPYIPRQFWTQGETRGSRCWFPTIDEMNQKHLQQITITYPDTMISVSNGYKVSHVLDAGKHEYTDVWKMTQPHSVYLTMLAVGNWAEITDKYKDKVLHYYVEPRFKNDAMKIFGNTPEMIDFFSKYTGVEFPWNKFDQIVARNFVSGAMENTTAVIHSEDLQDKDNHMEDYISHELFHHWFGDYVTADNWGEITMNESFAKYAEFLWIEHKYGYERSQMWLQDNNEGWSPKHTEKDNALVNYFYKHPDDQFDQIRYNKGAAILNMLRNYIGDAAFRLAIKEYLTTYAYSNAGSAEWKRCVEKVTGKNMSAFFNVWYYSAGPYNNSWTFNINEDSSSAKYYITLFQLNKNQVIKPYKIDIEYGKIGQPKKTTSIVMDKDLETIDLDINEVPDFIHVDPNNVAVGRFTPLLDDNYLDTINSEWTAAAQTQLNQSIRILQNNILYANNSYQKFQNMLDFVNQINRIGAGEKLDSNTIYKIIFSCKNDSNPHIIEAIYELIGFIPSDGSELNAYAVKLLNNKILENPKVSAFVKSKVLRANEYQHLRTGIPFMFTDEQLIEYSKDPDFDLFDAVIECFQQVYCFSNLYGSRDSMMNTDQSFNNELINKGNPIWVSYAEGQLSSNIPSKRKARWLSLLIEYYIFKNKTSEIIHLLEYSDKLDIHIENFSSAYNTLYSFLVNDYNQSENASLILGEEIGRIIKTKNIPKIKLMKFITKTDFESGEYDQTIIESYRNFGISLKKLHNFEIK